MSKQTIYENEINRITDNNTVEFIQIMREEFIRNYPDDQPAALLKKGIEFFEHTEALFRNQEKNP